MHEISFLDGHIDVTLKKDVGWSRFIGFYDNLVVHKRKESWKLIKRLHQCSNHPWLIGGDSNEILSIDEKEGWAIRSQNQINNFREIR